MLQVGGYSPFDLFGVAFAVFALPFVLMGLYLLYIGVRKWRISGRRTEFEPVRARILSSDLRKSTGGRSGGVKWVPEIEYEFTVDGETYTSDSVWPGGDLAGTDEDHRQAIVDRYPEGEVVEAFYDPRDPSVSFLENESRGVASILLIVFGVGFVLAGLAAVGFGLLFVV